MLGRTTAIAARIVVTKIGLGIAIDYSLLVFSGITVVVDGLRQGAGTIRT